MKTNILSALAIAALLVLGEFTSAAQVQNPPYGTTWDCLLSGSGQQGIAFLTFSNDFTFTGFQLLVGKQSAASSSSSDRSPGGDQGRNSSGSTNAPIGGGTNLFGFGPVSGPWRYDVKGQVVGYFTETVTQSRGTSNWVDTTVTVSFSHTITDEAGGSLPVTVSKTNFTFTYTVDPFQTNAFWAAVANTGDIFQYSENFTFTPTSYAATIGYDVINSDYSLDSSTTRNFPPGSPNTIQWTAVSTDGTINQYSETFQFDPSYVAVSAAAVVTNGVSFTAKVVPGKRLNLISSTPYGKVTYKGVPQDQKPIPAPISGSWYGTKKENKQSILEFFTLLPSSLPNPYVANTANIFFTTNGNGPGLGFGGVSMVSVQKKIGFAFETFQGVVTNVATAAGGTLSATIGGINYPSKGAKANTKGFEEPIVPITFQAQRQGP